MDQIRHSRCPRYRCCRGGDCVTYTPQKNVDNLGLAELWACTFTNFINAGEYTRHEAASQDELDLIVGKAFRRGVALMSNYIDHSKMDKTAKDCTSWDEEDNPEWHYWVKKRLMLLHVVSEALNVVIDPRRFQVGIMLTQYNTKHYVLLTSAGQVINPDNSLKGEIIETRPFIY